MKLLRTVLVGIGMVAITVIAFGVIFVVLVNHKLTERAGSQPTTPLQVSSSINNPTVASWLPPPTSIPQNTTSQPDYGIPPDPGTGPYPACWVVGPIKGQPCPPKPSGWTPPPR